MANNNVTRKEFNELFGMVVNLTEAVNKLYEAETQKKAPTKKSTAKKSEVIEVKAEKKTREDSLTATYGTKEDRKDFAVLRNRVNDEWKKIRKDGGYKRSIPSKQYKAILDEFTRTLNGKWNAKAVKDGFMKYSKERKSA